MTKKYLSDKKTEKEDLLNQEQNWAKELVLSGQNVFITGAAGTGKSFLLKKLIKILQDKYGGEQVAVTSTTGTGAVIIGGNTIHSYLGIGIMGDLSPEFLLTRILSSAKFKNNWEKLKVLIIDEISMLDGRLFIKMEFLARKIKRNKLPFGGIQLLLVGDFCQLPPTNKEAAVYCFEVPAWNKCIEKSVNLTQIYRQKEDWFVHCLQMIRFGRLPKYYWEDILKKFDREPHWPNDGIKPIILFSRNQEVKKINENELAKLSSNSFFFYAHDKEKITGKLKELEKNCLSPVILELKIGAQVMLTRNWYDKNLFNGSQGVVIDFDKNKKNYPIVKFTNGKILTIEKYTWEKIEGYDKQNKPIVSASRTQIPLILSWAITIHKCQGQSIERLIIDLKNCFMGGQVYTALSRATNPDYLQISNFSYQKLWCDNKVRKFYDTLNDNKTDEIIISEKKAVNWHKKYIVNKIQKKYKEFLSVYEEKKKWPYKKIKEILSSQDEEYYKAFCRVVEKSISNSQDLIAYRGLLKYLDKWKKLQKNKSLIK